MKKIVKSFSLFGVIGIVFYFLHVIFGNIFYEGYNPMSRAISDLTAVNSPARNIAMIFSLFYGVFTLIFSICFFIFLKQKINKPVTYGACFFLIMQTVSFIGYTFFPLTESGYAGTFQDIMHLIVTGAVVLFTIAALILFIIGFLKTEKVKYLGIISLCTFLLLLIGTVLINIVPKEYFGLAERINVYSIVIYTGILSFWMYRRISIENKK